MRGPIERVKVQVQTAGAGATRVTTPAAIATIFREHGVRGFFRGTLTTQVREILQYVIYYPVYESLRAYADTVAGPKYGWLSVPLVGAAAGAAQWMPPSYCVDVVKTRLQSADNKYASMLDCARRSYAAEGVGVFFRGLNVAVIRAIPLHAGVFTGYEVTLGALSKYEAGDR